MATVSDKIIMLRRFVNDNKINVQDKFDGNGSSLIFRLNNAPIIEDSYEVIVGATTLIDETDYTIDLDTGDITFTTAPASGNDNVQITYQYAVLRNTEWLETINNILSTLKEKIWTDNIDETTLTSVVNQDDYDLSSISSQIIAVIGFWYKSSATATDWFAISGDTNVFFWKEQNKINLRPPLIVGGYPLRLRYLESYDLYSATTDTWIIPDRYFAVIQYFSAVEYLDRFLAKMVGNLGAKTTTLTYETVNSVRGLKSDYEKRAERALARTRPLMPATTIQTIFDGIKS